METETEKPHSHDGLIRPAHSKSKFWSTNAWPYATESLETCFGDVYKGFHGMRLVKLMGFPGTQHRKDSVMHFEGHRHALETERGPVSSTKRLTELKS